MFARAEEILKNPMLQMQHLTAEDCRVLTNEEQNHYTKRIIVEEKETVAREKRTCEQPANNIVCEKTLTVSCVDTEECERGGIVAGSLASNIYMHVNYPNISLGTTAKIRAPGRCEILDRTVSFHLKSHELISDFRITNISYSDWIRIKLNGVQVYNTTGGDGDFQMDVSRDGYFPDHHRCGVRSGGALVRCNTFDYYNIYPNIDLKPYLKEGENILRIELAFGRNGQLYMNLHAKQRCCAKTSERWDTRCWAE